MTVQIKSINKVCKHFQDVLKTFHYQNCSVVPAYGDTDVHIYVQANSANPIGKLSVKGRYSIMHDYFYIDLIGFCTSSEDVFFKTLNKLHTVITNLQMELDNGN